MFILYYRYRGQKGFTSKPTLLAEAGIGGSGVWKGVGVGRVIITELAKTDYNRRHGRSFLVDPCRVKV